MIDAQEGVRENSRRHGYMLSVLGIRQVVVVVNKMDLVDYSESRLPDLERLSTARSSPVRREGVAIHSPSSAGSGDNVVTAARTMAWYDGPTVLEAIDGFPQPPPPTAGSFRMPVQGVYKFVEADTISGGSSPAPC